VERKHAIFSARVGSVFLAPALAFVAVFLVYPFVRVFLLSFTNQTLLGVTAPHPEYVGLANYNRLFDTQRWMRLGEFGSALKITASFVTGSALIGQAGLGMLIAWAFYRRRGPLREAVFTLVILAWIIPETVVAFTWVAFLDWKFGTLNSILGVLGLGRPDWLFKHPLESIIIFNSWRGTAFSMLLFSGALETIPPSYVETAEVAGASAWQKFRDIFAPLLRGHILTDLILITLWTFNVFTPFLLTGGGPAKRTELVSIYTYRTAFMGRHEFGKGSAIAVVMMLINLSLALIYLASVRRRRVTA
jgi:multiple sugar transport system permease protein